MNQTYAPKTRDRVTIVIDGQKVLGMVEKGGNPAHVVTDDGKRYKAGAALLEKSSVPLPDHMLSSSFKKGDRVEFFNKGQLIVGTVEKGGTSPKVVRDGGIEAYTVPISALKLSSVAIPVDPPHPMDDWGLKNYSANTRLSEETEAFTSLITYKGKPVLQASNHGTGGCNSYHGIAGQNREMIAKLDADAKQWMIDHGMPEDRVFEATDFWINWKSSGAKYGVTAKAYIEEYNTSMEQFSSPAP